MSDPHDFFRKRGINPAGDVFRLRGYTRFESEAELLAKAKGYQALRDGGFSFKAHWLNRGESGWIFPRYATGAEDDPLPQIRVDVAPVGRRERHRHVGMVHVPGETRDADGTRAVCSCGAKTPHEDWIYQRAFGRKRLIAHLAKDPPEGHGIDVAKLRPWINRREYGILAYDVPEGEPVPDLYDVDGVAVWLWSLGHGGVHEHWSEKKYLLPPGPQGKRLDHNPYLTERDFIEAERIFFVLEGVAKTDALTEAGEVVFGVPSVTSWVAPELDAWLRTLPRVPVYIVPDSDWITNDNVRAQAYLCREYLRSRGFAEAEVAAPPPRRQPDETGSVKAGVDDHLGELGLTVDDLVVYPGPTPDVSAVPLRKTPGPWQQRYDTKAFAYRWLQLLVPPNPETWKSAEGLANSITIAAHRRLLDGGYSEDPFWTLPKEAQRQQLDTPARNVRNALHDLAEDGLIRYVHDSEWVEERETRGRKAETIRVDGELREIPARDPFSLGPGYERGTPIIELVEPVQHGEPIPLAQRALA